MDVAPDEPAANAASLAEHTSTTANPAAAAIKEDPKPSPANLATTDTTTAVKEEPTLEDGKADVKTTTAQATLQVRKKAKPTRHGKRSPGHDDGGDGGDGGDGEDVKPSKTFLPAGLFSSHYKVPVATWTIP